MELEESVEIDKVFDNKNKIPNELVNVAVLNGFPQSSDYSTNEIFLALATTASKTNNPIV